MRITMIKKRLANGEPCQKCAQTEEMLQRRGHWGAIDEVVWAVEGEPDAPGWAYASRHGIEVAPFFVIEIDGEEIALTSPLRLIKTYLDAPARPAPPASFDEAELAAWAEGLADASPEQVLEAGLDRFADNIAIAFSGGLDVVLVDMASRMGKPFRVFTLDTGRLHQETYAYMDEVRRRYGVELEVFLPDAAEAMDLMSRHGANSFLREGHAGCCAVRQVRPLARALEGRSAWVTGRMAHGESDPAARVVAIDPKRDGASSGLVRLDPLARWSRERTLDYARAHDVPLNPLFEQGHVVIGCAPCTRAIGPDDPPRAVRWWWEAGAGGAAVVSGEGDGI
jgi:phosphoadenosine phosphosulfate reductase